MDFADETLLYIFSYLSSVADKFALTQVNRQWRRVALDHTLWRDVLLCLRDAFRLANANPAALNRVTLNDGMRADKWMSMALLLGWSAVGLSQARDVTFFTNARALSAPLRLFRGPTVHSLHFVECTMQLESLTGNYYTTRTDVDNDITRAQLIQPFETTFALSQFTGLRHLEWRYGGQYIMNSMLAVYFLSLPQPIETLRVQCSNSDFNRLFWKVPPTPSMVDSLKVLEVDAPIRAGTRTGAAHAPWLPASRLSALEALYWKEYSSDIFGEDSNEELPPPPALQELSLSGPWGHRASSRLEHLRRWISIEYSKRKVEPPMAENFPRLEYVELQVHMRSSVDITWTVAFFLSSPSIQEVAIAVHRRQQLDAVRAEAQRMGVSIVEDVLKLGTPRMRSEPIGDVWLCLKKNIHAPSLRHSVLLR